MNDFFEPLDANFFDGLDERKRKPVDAVPTPLPGWNRVCRDEGGGIGLARGWHVTVGGNTGHGKSVLMLNMVARAMKAGERVGVVSLEMSRDQLATRLMAIVSGISVRRLEHGPQYEPKDARSADEYFERLNEDGGAVFVNPEPINDMEGVDRAFRWLAAEDCGIVFTDYVQLVWTDADQQTQQITEVSHNLRRLAKENNVVSVALSQYNRATSATKETPQVQGLNGGSALENDSDQVGLLDHSTYERHSPDRATCDLVIGKNRHGSSGAIPIEFNYKNLRVTEVLTDE